MNDFSVKLGWDTIIYSQLGAGIFDGEYLEGISQSLIVTKENISVPLSMKGGGVPGYIALGMYLSPAPAKVNGVIEGKIKINTSLYLTPDIREALENLQGKLCKPWNNSNKSYFDWQAKRYGIQDPNL